VLERAVGSRPDQRAEQDRQAVVEQAAVDQVEHLDRAVAAQ
jgi:hypothetical protein